MKTYGIKKIRKMYKEMGIIYKKPSMLSVDTPDDIEKKEIDIDFIISSHTNYELNSKGEGNAQLASD